MVAEAQPRAFRLHVQKLAKLDFRVLLSVTNQPRTPRVRFACEVLGTQAGGKGLEQPFFNILSHRPVPKCGLSTMVV